MRRILALVAAGVAAVLAFRFWVSERRQDSLARREAWVLSQGAQADEASSPKPQEGHKALAEAAFDETRRKVTYDPSYVKIPYPGGDVPADRGVCADVLVRVFRRIGVDLQKEVHEDMEAHFGDYPNLWNLRKPDPNIDHRRVPNLMNFFRRRKAELKATDKAGDYVPGDLVAWDLGRGVLHIGIVSDRRSADGKRFQVVHNVGSGQVLEDVLFAWKVLGHFRWAGP